MLAFWFGLAALALAIRLAIVLMPMRTVRIEATKKRRTRRIEVGEIDNVVLAIRSSWARPVPVKVTCAPVINNVKWFTVEEVL